MIRIGILGRGFMAQVHALRYAAMDDATVSALASPSHPATFVAEYAPDAAVYDDAETMYDEAELDAVDICTPTHTHRKLVEGAAERGLHVLCENPLERTLEDSFAIADSVAEAGVTCMPAHVLRFFPEYVKARDHVNRGEIGSPGTVRAVRQSPFAEKSGWFLDPAKSGGVLLDLAIHDFDYLRWLLGDVERVFARTREWDQHEYALTTLRFENDVVGHVDTRWPHRPDLPFVTRFELAGDEGLIEFDSQLVNPIDVYSTIDDEGPAQDPIDMPLTKDPYRLELEHFVSCVQGGSEPSITLEDGIEAVRISLAAIESAATGQPVAPEEVTP